MSDSASNLTSIALAGATGRMTGEILKALKAKEDFRLEAVYHRSESEYLDQDSGLISGLESNGVSVSALPTDSRNGASPYQVLIDFTQPQATMNYLRHCVQQKTALLIGTTGFDDEQLSALAKASEQIPVLLAPNTALGVNLCFGLLRQAAAAVGSSADIEIIECHHRNKVDAPSGTALKMGEIIADQLGRNLSQNGVFSRHGNIGERGGKDIGFSSIRAGDVIGEHTVLFALDGERIEITHKASSRAIYAEGALQAAKWLSTQSCGIYSMQNVLGLN